MSRIERIEAELAKQIAIAISDGIKDPRVKGLISVTKVTVDTELSYAKVYVSILGADGEEEKVIQGLDSAQGYIKSKLRKTMRLRAMPELHFVYDDSIAYGIYMNQRLSEIVKKDEDANE
ncbi:MAG: 30S ribosome-binding factor RbfA [Christensenella sp.]|nr:30S ribosome-binding factor RbfA [Christensenella sp.]